MTATWLFGDAVVRSAVDTWLEADIRGAPCDGEVIAASRYRRVVRLSIERDGAQETIIVKEFRDPRMSDAAGKALLARIKRVASKPSSSGIWQSISTRS